MDEVGKTDAPVTGLFLGAGASFELGMPLVWDLTDELKNWLTPEKLRALNIGWRAQGSGIPNEAIEELANILKLQNLHYESILGHLETQFRRQTQIAKGSHHLYSWLVEIVYHILALRHFNNVAYIEGNLRYFQGITELAAKNEPLWVFSLNHDLMIECIAAHFKVPLNCGFSSEIITLPRRNNEGKIIGELKGQVLSGVHLEKSAMPFFTKGNRGINLLKIHGALDIFTFRDGKDLLKLLPPEGATTKEIIQMLRSANEELLYAEPALPSGMVKTTNEIAYADENGVMQFLRRSLLAGAYKFDSRGSQVLPIRLLDHFRSNLNHISKLVCVGYGFGDNHINQIMKEWLQFNGDRKIEIVGPACAMPTDFLHLSPQITLVKTGASDYFDSVSGIVRSRREAVEKRYAAWVRTHRSDADKAAFLEFAKEHQLDRIKAVAEKLKSLPLKNGDLDLETLGLTGEEFTKQVLKENHISIEDLLESFLDSQK